MSLKINSETKVILMFYFSLFIMSIYIIFPFLNIIVGRMGLGLLLVSMYLTYKQNK